MFKASATAEKIKCFSDGNEIFRVSCYLDDNQNMAIKETVKIYHIIAPCDRIAAFKALDLFELDTQPSEGEKRGLSTCSTAIPSIPIPSAT